MKTTEASIEQVKTAFLAMENREDLLNLLNIAKPIVYGEKAKPFELKQLSWYANPKIAGKRYKDFLIKKKSGEYRIISSPVKGLKAIQRTLAFVLQCVFTPHEAAKGFVWGKSIVDNAKLHESKYYVFNLDLKDFFPSIDQARVWKCLQLKPFNLKDTNNETGTDNINTGLRKIVTDHKETLYYKFEKGELSIINDKKGNLKKYLNRLIPLTSDLNLYEDLLTFLAQEEEKKMIQSDIIMSDFKRYLQVPSVIKYFDFNSSGKISIANIISALCCTEMEVERMDDKGAWTNVKKNVLPQGAPTSPVITNIVCQKLDFLLTSVAKRFGLTYSRYADDITFSSMHNVYQQGSDFRIELERVIKDQRFHIKETKTRLQKEGHRKEVTGLLVNGKTNVQHRYIKQLRMWLYYWETYGYERAYSFFLQDYLADKENIVKGKPDMANVIGGKLDYLRMVRGGDNEMYVKLKERFHRLVPQTGKVAIERNEHLNTVLELLFLNGIDAALDFYKSENNG